MASRRTTKKKKPRKVETNPHVEEILDTPVAELTPEQVKAAQPAPQQAQAQQQGQQGQQGQRGQLGPCSKCGHDRYTVQWRKVLVNVGWHSTQLHAVAPVPMCVHCFEPNVQIRTEVGDLAGLVPADQVAQPASNQSG